MKRSTDRILTTHAGSLPRPEELSPILTARDEGMDYDHAAFEALTRQAVADVVARQVETGIDVVGDGEQSKSNFALYGRIRLEGIGNIGGERPYRAGTRDHHEFPEVYQEAAVMNAARTAGRRPYAMRPATACTGPVRYVGEADVARDLDNLSAALDGRAYEEAFVTAVSPTNLQLYHPNEYYPDDDAYLDALSAAMNVEFRAIVDAGYILQIDDPRLATHYNRTPSASLEDCRRFIDRSVESINAALDGIPPEKVRFHTCYSVNVAPRVHDLELKHYIAQMLTIKAQAFSFEASNPRHEHEWSVWADAKLPDGTILIPGVVSHCIHLVEHPELVAQRIERYAGIVGRENVIAGTDCGFATAADGDTVHPTVAWAKLAALVEGARIASARLWGRKAA